MVRENRWIRKSRSNEKKEGKVGYLGIVYSTGGEGLFSGGLHIMITS